MKIKSIDLIGFKSFYNKTSVSFRDGINLIVGPNGCGKSNIFDAVKWVLGEQTARQLRADGMQDIISNGSDKLKRLGMAEVSLTLEDVPNLSFEEVVIKRRVFRSGESEYSINGVKCRLKDITEMFLDTGVGARTYSIVTQGSVESFITAKPEEKRKLIEEVAGVVKYKTRRKEAQSRIESTRENLIRLLDTKKEVFTQMTALGEQARQAERYKQLEEQSNIVEYSIVQKKLESAYGTKTDIDNQLLALNDKIDRLKTDKTQKQELLNEKELTTADLTVSCERVEKEINRVKVDLQGKKSDKQLALQKITTIDDYAKKQKSDIEKLKREITVLEQSGAQRAEEIESLNLSISSITEKISEKEQFLTAQREQSESRKKELEQTSENLRATLTQQSSLKSTVEAYGKDIEELAQRKEAINSQLSSLRKDENVSSARLSELEAKQSQIKKNSEKNRSEKETLDKLLDDLKAELEKKSKELSQNESARNDCKARIDVIKQMQANYEWLPQATREFVLSKKGNGVLGVVSDFVDSAAHYEKAVEAAFGEKLNWIVVQKNQEAIYAIESLRASSVGKGTFIPVKDRVHSAPYETNGHKVVGINEYVKVNGIDKEFVDSILNGVFVASDLKEAFSMKSDMGNGACFTTLKGDFIDANGAITGGFTSGGVFERKREIESLQETVDSLEQNIKKFENEEAHLKTKIKETELNVKQSEELLKQFEIKLAENIKDQANLKTNLEKIRVQLKGMDLDYLSVETNLKEKEQKVAEITDQLDNLRQKKTVYDQRFKEYQQQVSEFQNREKTADGEITDLKIKKVEISAKKKSLNNEVERAGSMKVALKNKIAVESKEFELKNEEKADLLLQVQKAEGEINTLSELLLSEQRRLEELQASTNNGKDNAHALKEEVESLNDALADQNDRQTNLQIKLVGADAEIKTLQQRFNEIKKPPFNNDTNPDIKADDSFNIAEAEKRLRSLNRQIENFGDVNQLAPEEHKKLEERHTFLNKQIEDIQDALASLNVAINKLDKESVAKFKEAFEIINKKFSQIFSRLFEGGEGKLIITNPDDILNTGIDLFVRPKGKKFQSINLLSGGEKALSAIALVISACFVKPVPFLLFDEIDAPLDELNTVRFLKLLTEIAKESQIVMVTHNKRTMQEKEVATLIGITSDRSTTSTVVNVKLN